MLTIFLFDKKPGVSGDVRALELVEFYRLADVGEQISYIPRFAARTAYDNAIDKAKTDAKKQGFKFEVVDADDALVAVLIQKKIGRRTLPPKRIEKHIRLFDISPAFLAVSKGVTPDEAQSLGIAN